uniref:Fructoselysine kinase n=1 Tax=Anthurium amnicola TaxID=1678845 RepID=A0A1D1XL11_9ARAE
MGAAPPNQPQGDDSATAADPPPPPPPPPSSAPSGIVVGNYCHDVLSRDGVVVGESLGGAASFISNVFAALHLCCRYVSMVGTDFAYGGPPLPIPSFSSSSPTTLFHAHFSSSADPAVTYHGDRRLRLVHACEPISPRQLPDGGPFDFGLAVGVAGEISPPTLSRMIDLCRLLFVDAQSLIRTFHPVDGTVGLVPLSDTAFSHLLPRIAFLKASADEAPFLDIEQLRKSCCVLVTQGKDGCTLYWDSGVLRVPPFPAVQVDPTGAGDSFLGGFVAGVVQGLTVPDAALLGNFFGSLTVGHIGVPKFHPGMLQRVRGELERRTPCGASGGRVEIAASYQVPKGHAEFRAFLAEAAGRESQNATEQVVSNHDNQ